MSILGETFKPFVYGTLNPPVYELRWIISTTYLSSTFITFPTYLSRIPSALFAGLHLVHFILFLLLLW